MSPNIPPELFDNIFFHLRASIDFASLYACTQVSGYFSALAEPHLYHRLVVSDQNACNGAPIEYTTYTTYRGHSLSQVLQLLADKPHILDKGYIRVLELKIKARRSAGGSQSDEARCSYDTDLARLLPLLTTLERVVVGQRGSCRLEWTRLTKDPELQRAFHEVLGLPSVREVSLQGFKDLPLEVLEIPTAALRVLNLECQLAMDALAGSDPSPPCSRTTRRRRPDLLSLALNYVRGGTLSRFLAWADSPSGCNLAGLENLEAVFSLDDCMYIACALSRCSGSLKTLQLTNPWPATTNFTYQFDTEERNYTQRRSLDKLGFNRHPFSFTLSAFSPSEPLSLPAPFSLACLSSLEHLRLYLPIQTDPLYYDPTVRTLVYSAPFELIRGVLEEITAGRPRQAGGSNSRVALLAEDFERDGDNSGRGAAGDSHDQVPLRRLTLDMRFGEYLLANASLVRGISWKPLASALTAFCEAAPLVEVVELNAVVEGLAILPDLTNLWLENVLEVWNADVHLAPLIAAGLVRVSGKRLDDSIHCL